MIGELIGEFKGKNTVYRVLPDGKMETSAQGTGKILGIDAFIASTTTGAMVNGLFAGESNSIITTVTGETVFLKGTAIGWPGDKGGITRATSNQTTQAPRLARLNRVLGLHEYETDMENNWIGKIWEWK